MTVIPEEMQASLLEAFGDAKIEEVVPLAGGRSGAKLFSLVVEGRAYVVRRGANMGGRAVEGSRELACMRIAAEGGIAPAIAHVDEARRVVVMEHIERAVVTGRFTDDTLDRVGRTLRRLHDGPLFPASPPLATTFSLLDSALRAQGGEGVSKALLATVDHLAKVVAHGARRVSCHNDLNPSNILVRGDRVFFIDWEAAGAGDPFFDLGTLGVFACSTPEARARVLHAYLDRAPSEEERARSVIGRVLALAFYSGAFTFVSHLHGQSLDGAVAKPLREVFSAMATTPPNVVAASLAAETAREHESEACLRACAFLSP